ncbi:MAG: PD-(D/E)XK nuclease family protein [Sulfurimonadaceae bacterium]
MSTTTTILPTSRAIRSHILKEQSEDGFLSNYLTIGEFLQRVLRVDGYHRIDEDSRTLLLLEAADFKNFATLNIERNFFTFTQNASYLFRFFEELSGELVDIESLEFADTYGDYEEHITILQELYIRYKDLCEEKKILDPIFLPQQYALNESYLRTLGEVELYALGYLTNFEMEVLMACADLIPLSLRFSANQFNAKLSKKFKELGIAVVDNSAQRINLQTLLVDDVTPIKEEIHATIESFSQSLLQVGFIKQKVYSFIERGMAPEKIVVVLPDENFAQHLRRFDEEGNFNFAMGIPLSHSIFIESLEAVMQYLENKTVENTARLNRVGGELLEGLYANYRSAANSLDFSTLMEPFLEKEHDKAVIDIVREELYYFEKIIPVLGDAPLKSALHLFTNRLKTKSIDDVRGGKITVMGVLETRLVEYEGVIVVNFNEGVVPRKSEKDLFLNSATRHNAGLPTTSEREDLQKLYYHSLFTHAKEVMIAYASSTDAVPSRFLTQLGLALGGTQRDALYAPIVMPIQSHQKTLLTSIEGEYDFSKRPLSATGLKAFLTCRRKFYHKYIEGIKSHEIAQDMPKEHEIGTALHEALKIVYEEQNSFSDIVALKKEVAKALEQSSGKSVLDKYLNKLWMKRLEPFFENEIARFREVRVHSCEKKLETEIRGVKLFGVIDRIDSTVDGLEVLDYKSGKYTTYTLKTLENAKDFQLEFYYLLAATLGEVNNCGFYDLNSGKIVYEPVLNEKLEKLYTVLDELRETKHFDFEMTEKLSDCGYCEYAYLCQRGL